MQNRYSKSGSQSLILFHTKDTVYHYIWILASEEKAVAWGCYMRERGEPWKGAGTGSRRQTGQGMVSLAEAL